VLRPEDVRDEFADLYRRKQFVNGTLEIIGESFIASEASLFGLPNEEYIRKELDWYSSGSTNVNDIPGGPPTIWKQIASPDGEINSNYGYLLFGEANGFQYDNVYKTLVADPGSRRATAIYTRPTMHQDWNRDGMADFVCTNAVQYLIRNGKLHLVVQMRSNDVVFGYRNDWAWHRYTQELLLTELQGQGITVTRGDITWNAASLHLYERHFWIIENYIETGYPFPKLTK
jgi:thymidylate synthase